MSRQLAASTALSIMAMLACALFAAPSVPFPAQSDQPQISMEASTQALPLLSRLLPALQ